MNFLLQLKTWGSIFFPSPKSISQIKEHKKMLKTFVLSIFYLIISGAIELPKGERTCLQSCSHR